MTKCAACGKRDGLLLLSDGGDEHVCPQCYDAYYAQHPEYAVNAPYYTAAVAAAGLNATRGQLIRHLADRDEYIIGAAPGSHHVGDTITVQPWYGQHAACPDAAYTVRITQAGPTFRHPAVQQYAVEIVGRSGHTDW